MEIKKNIKKIYSLILIITLFLVNNVYAFGLNLQDHNIIKVSYVNDVIKNYNSANNGSQTFKAKFEYYIWNNQDPYSSVCDLYTYNTTCTYTSNN